MTRDQSDRYLSLLGVPREAPALPALARLVAAHLARIPFENVSKLIRHARGEPATLDELDEFLDRIERSNLGGTCYACASHFNALLDGLGYDARLCGAAMDQPDVHAVNVIAVDGHEYLVDVGFAAPFFTPLPLDEQDPVVVPLGRESYVLQPRSAEGNNRLDHLEDGAVIHGYTLDRTPREPAHFRAVIADSFRSDSTFLNRLRIVRHTPERSISLRNFTITVTEGDTIRTRTLPGPEALADVVEVLLGIPASTAREALAALGNRI